MFKYNIQTTVFGYKLCGHLIKNYNIVSWEEIRLSRYFNGNSDITLQFNSDLFEQNIVKCTNYNTVNIEILHSKIYQVGVCLTYVKL